MPYGLRVWDSSGNLTLDTTDRITRFVTSITPGTIAANSTVSYSVPGIVADGTWFIVVYNTFMPAANAFYSGIVLSITTNNINLYNSNSNANWTNGLNTRIEVLRG